MCHKNLCIPPSLYVYNFKYLEFTQKPIIYLKLPLGQPKPVTTSPSRLSLLMAQTPQIHAGEAH